MKNINPLGLFDEHFLLERLTKLKGPLVKFEEHVDWQIFAPILDLVFAKPKNSGKTGRPPFNRIMMFKIMILQSLYNLPRVILYYTGSDGIPDYRSPMLHESKARARVEHVFGYMTNSMNGMYIKTIGIFRAAAKIGISNLTYNMMRCVQLNKKVPAVFLE